MAAFVGSVIHVKAAGAQTESMHAWGAYVNSHPVL